MKQLNSRKNPLSEQTGMNQMELSSEELRSLPPRPPIIPAASPKRRFVKVGRKTSDGSQQSASSTSSSSRSAEGVTIRQPSKGRIRRHTNRLSGVFLRVPASSPASMALTAGIRSSLSIQPRKGSVISADVLKADDPSELSNQMTAPGILKIFGNDICEGAHYKSVLATTHSSARELVKEALERYGLGKREAESYVLCDTIGSIADHQWKTEGFRVVGENEKPLLLQSLWKPREGLARRFELQRKSCVDEKTAKDKDTITAGINAQARKLQKSRSRVTSTFMERTMGRNHKMWRSKSEMDLLDSDPENQLDTDQENCQKDRSVSLNHTSAQSYKSPKTSPEQNPIHSVTAPSEGDGGSRAKTESLCPSKQRGEREGEESEREETESSDDSTTQYSIHPPHDCPYLLLLQGCSPAQDFVIYLLAGQNIVFGRQSDIEDGSKPDILLFAADILPRHCYFHRLSVGSTPVLGPCPNAMVTKNGEVLREEVQLNPGDVIGLGQCYLFLFKDPVALTQKEGNNVPGPTMAVSPWILDHTTSAPTKSKTLILCDTCTTTCTDLQSSSSKQSLIRGQPFLKSPKGLSLTVKYETEDEYRIVKEIVAMGRSGIKDRPPLTVSFLLCLCVQYSSASLHTADLRRLLLLIASGVQSAMWDYTKDLAAAQPEPLNSEGSNDENLQDLVLQEVMSGLRPLVVWMSNSLELLHFIQFQLPLILEWRTRKEQGLEDEEGKEDEENKEAESWALLELRLSCVRSASEETLAVLEEVLLLAFQQCVYYITKVLYPILPGLLDCNPFRGTSVLEVSVDSAQVFGKGGLQVPGEIQQLVEVLTETWKLLSDCQLHAEISSQLIGYLFYFINASLFNSLMERGSERGFYQWSRGIRMRSNLNFLLDWAHTAGLGELALKHTHTLSSAINLLATPRKNLLQKSWVTLRSEYRALSPAQLNHLLSLYSPASPFKHTWAPSVHDQAAALKTDDILESFDTHHPLVLPDSGYQFQLRTEVTDLFLSEQLDTLKEFISSLCASKYDVVNATDEQKVGTSPAEMKLTKMVIHPASIQETLDKSAAEIFLSQSSLHELQSPSSPSAALPPSPPSPRSPPSIQCFNEISTSGALLLSHKLRNLEIQGRETDTGSIRRSALDPTCLPTPPNTPHIIHPIDLVKADKWVRGESETLPWSSSVDSYDKGGLMFECLSALKGDTFKSEYPSLKRFVKLREEEERQLGEEVDDHYDDDDYELFSIELERGACGVGLALIDTRDTSLRVKGVFIRAVVPDSPAARSDKLQPGDRILAVNGVSLFGLDYQSGKELIQSSGDRLRLLVARSEWMAKAIKAEC
ncbi:ras-associating and dilute domain-containing protein-like [Notolabrus celidotus]|uniref:ras-associating and dilute domain-containing protein-like n=1 Tax=Notolabrus celidotus TaxID=1203425 RepID=UPI00148FEF88|nr:ras-associating and dilute domain-containing protein-like [Notolabrus celidotus]